MSRRTSVSVVRRRMLICLGLVAAAGCWYGEAADEVVVYSALDREFSEPLLQEFERSSGIKTLAKFDIESTKTVGLANAILQERANPRCDLFWNNEILHTIRLERAGVLERFTPRHAADVPDAFRAPSGTYYGFAARARVLLVNTQVVSDQDAPRSIRDLVDPRWKGRVGIAKPLFGTTATHAAVLFAAWGDVEATAYFERLFANASIMSGNKQVAEAVGSGQIAFGLTDTDDAVIEIEAARPVRIVFPDQEEGGLGALFIPNTLCLIKGSRHAEQARSLAEFLLSPETEGKLAAGASAQIPILLSSAEKARSRIEPPEPVRWMQADFPAAEAKWQAASQVLHRLLK